jgi:hypothetical protein
MSTGALTLPVDNFADGSATGADARMRRPVACGAGAATRVSRIGKLDALALLVGAAAPITFCVAKLLDDSTSKVEIGRLVDCGTIPGCAFASRTCVAGRTGLAGIGSASSGAGAETDLAANGFEIASSAPAVSTLDGVSKELAAT